MVSGGHSSSLGWAGSPGPEAPPGPGELNLLYRIRLRTLRGSKGGQTWGTNGGGEGLGAHLDGLRLSMNNELGTSWTLLVVQLKSL